MPTVPSASPTEAADEVSTMRATPGAAAARADGVRGPSTFTRIISSGSLGQWLFRPATW